MTLNYRYTFLVMSILLILFTGSMVAPLFVTIYEVIFHQAHDQINVLTAFAISLAIGLTSNFFIYMKFKNTKLKKLGPKDALFVVSFCWFFGGAIGALPHYIWAILHYATTGITHPFLNFINCYFETISGLTTTGASILSDIAALPSGLLFWRAFVQWIGGLGIVVLFVAVLPMIASGNKKLFNTESSGIGSSSTTARIQDTAKALWLIYVGFTLIETLILIVADSNLTIFQAFTTSLSTASTAGFSVFNESIGTFNYSAQWVVIFFMFLGGVNYTLFYRFLHGERSVFFKDTEFKTYVGILLVAIFALMIVVFPSSYENMSGQVTPNTFAKVSQDAAFQAVSIQTTTGFSNANSDLWPNTAKLILLLLMFIGGSAGSTAGGIKVVRVVAMFKMIKTELERVYRREVVRPCVIGNAKLSANQLHSILIHVIIVVLLCAFGGLALSILESSKQIDLSTAFSAATATVNNIGPGFSMVGATQNYAWFSNISKVILCFLMIIGRLEVFAVLAIFTPRFWRH